MTRFWWVRHGPTHERAFVGWRDVPADLSDTAALDRLDRFLPRPAILISSDLQRCTATADALAAGRERLPHDPDLREFHFGDWDGKRFDDIARSDPVLSRAYWETPGHVAPPGGESWYQSEARVARAVERLMRSHTGKDIVVVAHFGVILSQVRRARDVAPVDVLSQKIDNLSVTCVATDGSIDILNHVP